MKTIPTTITPGTIEQNQFSRSLNAADLSNKLTGRLEAVFEIAKEISGSKLVKQQKLAMLVSLSDVLIDLGQDLSLQIQCLVIMSEDPEKAGKTEKDEGSRF
jgi:hypothetical protein